MQVARFGLWGRRAYDKFSLWLFGQCEMKQKSDAWKALRFKDRLEETVEMKILIETPGEGQEDEVIFRCSHIDEEMMAFIQMLKNGKRKVSVRSETGIVMLSLGEIFYFESVDSRTFAYTENNVFEIKRKLYELEQEYGDTDFIRISKSVIVNVSKIVHLKPLLYGRFEGKLKNEEKVIVSRQYIGNLRKKLGL